MTNSGDTFEKRSSTLAISMSADPAYPLRDFYTAAGLPLPKLEPLPGEQVPAPYRDLLVHRKDMTPVLETLCKQPILLRVLSKRVDQSMLYREVALISQEDQRVTAFGAIRINLDRFDDEPKKLILACQHPLGSILQRYQMAHTSCPTAYFRLHADMVMKQALESRFEGWLYGRHNHLANPQQQPLAEVVEILSPIAQ